MATKPNKRLKDLESKARLEGRWPLVAAASMALADESNLDHQINVIGAMHESGRLPNQLLPFWQAWRTDEPAWAARCLERLDKGDRDYWALAALLGMDIKKTRSTFKSAGYTVTSVRSCARFDKAATHIAVLTKLTGGNAGTGEGSRIWAPVLEIGWDSKTGEIVDTGRWRAIIVEKLEKANNGLLGEGDGTYFLRAVLPHGAWRVENAKFEIAREALVAVDSTFWGKG
jgi:hypothetical protein